MKKTKTFLFSTFFSLISFFSLSRMALADLSPSPFDPCHQTGNCPKSLGQVLYEERVEKFEHIAIGVLVMVIVLVAVIVIIKIRKKK